jgi:hypothetical protein
MNPGLELAIRRQYTESGTGVMPHVLFMPDKPR